MVAINYPSTPNFYDPESVMQATQRGYQAGKDYRDEKNAAATFGRYLESLYGGQGSAPQTLSSLGQQFTAPAPGTVQRAPLDAPMDAPTARVEAAFSAQGQPSVGEMRQYIAQAAAKRGIDPATAIRVAQSEGLGQGIWQSNVTKNGVREPSYGPFQMLVGGGNTGFPEGLGNAFQQQTGLDPSDPKNWQASIDFALDTAAKSGWGQWYGAKNAGISNMQGINGAAAPAPAQQAVSTLATGQPVQVADASGAVPAPQGGSILPPREVMGELFANPVTRPFAVDLAKAAQGLRIDANDPQKQLEYQIAVEKLKALRDPQSKLINAGGGAIYDPNTKQWITPPLGVGGSGETGLTPVMLQDGNGNLIYGQPNKSGQIVRSKVPEGFSPVSPYDKSFQTSRGKVEGEANADPTRIAAQSALGSTLSSLDRLGNAAADVAADPSLGRITGVAGMIPNMPGGAAAGVQARLNTLKTQIGFTVLQAMREASKTGGALGAISDRENEMLQNALASLDQAQSEDDLKRELGKISEYVQGAKQRLQNAFDQTYPGQGGQAPAGGDGWQDLGNGIRVRKVQ